MRYDVVPLVDVGNVNENRPFFAVAGITLLATTREAPAPTRRVRATVTPRNGVTIPPIAALLLTFISDADSVLVSLTRTFAAP